MDQHYYPKQKLLFTNWALFSFLLLSAFLFLFLLSSSFSPHPLLSLHKQTHQHQPPSSSSSFFNLSPNSPVAIDEAGDELEVALAKASMGKKKTVIITVINKAYAEADVAEDISMLDLFLQSFWVGEGTRSLVDHLLIVSVDRTA